MERSHSLEANTSQAIPVSTFMEQNSAPLVPVVDKLIQSTNSQSISLWFTLILSFHIHPAIAVKGKNLRVRTYRVLEFLRV